MAQALAGDRDLTTTNWSIGTLRDYFLTLINANNARYEQEHNCLRDLINALDVRYEQRFKAQEVAVVVAREEHGRWLTEVLHERDIKYDQRFQASQEAIRLASTNTSALREAHEKQDLTEHAAAAALLGKTIDGLRAETFSGLNAMRDAFRGQLENTERALSKADIANEKRFDGVNEFRASLADQQRMLMPRQEVEVIVKSLTEKIDAQVRTLREQNERIVALTAAQAGQREGQHTGWSWAVGIVGLVLAVTSLVTMLTNHLAK